MSPLFKKILFFLATAITLIAATNDQIIDAIKANPSLLDSPQTKQYLQQKSTPTTARTAVSETPINLLDTNITKKRTETLRNDGEKPINAFKEMTKSPLTIESQDDYYQRLMMKQIKQKSKPLERYGLEFFTNRNNVDLASLPVPEDYRLVPKDTLNVTLYGPKNDVLNLTIDKEGNVVLPTFGPLHIGGLSYSEAKKSLTQALIATYPNVGVTVAITQFSTIQLTVTGEVEAPGLYNLSSFATLKDALIAAGGITQTGSMRHVMIKRGSKLVATIDLYALIRGQNTTPLLLRAGDTIVVPVAGAMVWLDGAVKKPAIYELKGRETLSDILTIAGGLSAQASKYDITITRYGNNDHIDILSVTSSQASTTPLKDQDKIVAYPIDKSNTYGITLLGNVVKPGFYPLPKEGMTLDAIFQNEMAHGGLRKIFLENTAFDYAMIKRTTSDMKEEIIGFSLINALEGKEKIKLHNRDELYILNRDYMSSAPSVSIYGECIARPGEYRFYPGLSVTDLIMTAGIGLAKKESNLSDTNLTESNTTKVSLLDRNDTNVSLPPCVIDKTKIRVLSYDENFSVTTTIVDITSNPRYTLKYHDRVIVYAGYTTNPLAFATISGEVTKAGDYEVGNGMTIIDFIQAAGGLTDKADRTKIEIVKNSIIQGKRQQKVITLSWEEALKSSYKIERYDTVNIRRIPMWDEKKIVKIYGKVMYPGEYVIQDGDKLSDLIKRAGGFTPTAFIDGAVFTRLDVKKMQEEGLKRQLKDLEQKIVALSATPTKAGETQQDKTMLLSLLGSLKAQATSIDLPGRLNVKLNRDMSLLAQSSYDIILKNGDALYIPEQEDSVVVMGEVMNPTAMIWNASYSAESYIQKAGGYKDSADESNAFVIHANGEAEKLTSGYFTFNATKVGRNDTIIVPMKLQLSSGIQFAKDITAILYQLAVSVSALKTIGAF